MTDALPLQGFTQGGEGYIGIKIHWRPGDVSDKAAWEAPDDWLLAETKGLDQMFAHIEHDAFVESRDTDKGHRMGKATAGGPFTFALYPTNGDEVWEAAYGFKADVSAIPSDTTTSIQNGAMTPPTAPTTTPSAAGGTLVAGTYKYAITFTTAYGETTLGTQTAGDVLTGGTSSDALSAIPVGPVGTTGRNVYRKKDAGAFGLVHSLADNTTATWTDTGATAGAAPPVYNTSLPSQVSVLGLAAGSADYTKGIPVLVGVGLNQEIRQVLKYEGTPKWLTVGLLGERDGVEINHSSAGTAVVAVACKVTRPIADTDFARNYANLLPVVVMEDNIGGKYAWRYRFGYLGKLDLKAAPAKVMVNAEVMFNKPRVLANGEGTNPAPTAFDDSQSDLEDLSFEYQDGFLAINTDPDSTQVPMLQRFDDGVEWELNLNNNLKEESPMDGSRVKRFLPGAKRKLDLKLKTLNAADYPVIYQEFLSKDRDAEFFAQFAQNVGTDSNPSWKFRGFYLPHVRYVKDTEVNGLTDTVGENVEAIARRAAGLEKAYIYSL